MALFYCFVQECCLSSLVSYYVYDDTWKYLPTFRLQPHPTTNSRTSKYFTIGYQSIPSGFPCFILESQDVMVLRAAGWKSLIP